MGQGAHGAELWLDSLAELVSFNFAGGVAQRLLGPTLRPWEHSLEAQTRAVESREAEVLLGNPNLAGEGPGLVWGPLFMSKGKGDGNIKPGSGSFLNPGRQPPEPPPESPRDTRIEVDMHRVAANMDRISRGFPVYKKAKPSLIVPDRETIPQLLSAPEELSPLLLKFLNGPSGALPPLVLLGPPSSALEFNFFTKGLGPKLQEGSRLELWVPALQKVFVGVPQKADIQWTESAGPFPKECLQSSTSGKYSAADPLELTLVLYQMSREPGRTEQSLSFIQYGKDVIPRRLQDFVFEL
jgi:hypothetical protein